MLLPGEGAEIYRGLAAVIIDGMTFSALFSLSFIAALLSMTVFSPNKKIVLAMSKQRKTIYHRHYRGVMPITIINGISRVCDK